MMGQYDICRTYLDALNESDLEKVLSLFTTDAIVESPSYGTRPAVKFYSELFDDTNESRTSLLNVFTSAGGAVALHFKYSWKLKNDQLQNFECVDVFSLNKSKNKFEKLTIIYDTHHLREDFSNVKNA